MAQWTGAWLLAAALAATALAWKRRPVTAFAIAWMALALLPVSNVIIPTGVVVAERTLFLASAGFVLLIGDLTAAVSAHRDKVRRPYRIAGAIAMVTLLLLGAGKSLSRYPVWKNQLTLFQQSVIDAPKSYKAHWGLANVLVELDALPLAEARFRLAIDLYPDEPRLLQRLADVYRQASLCAPAVPLYRRALEIRPEFWSIRVSLVGCLVHLGQYREARAVATMGVARGENVTNFQHFLVTIDSAAAVSAPPGAVALTAVEPNPALESAVP
jgi:tetratricopeptide (TPR) repeat protein